MTPGRDDRSSETGTAPLSPRSEAEAKREFEELLSPILDNLYGAALRMTRNSTDAEDLVQDAVLKGYRFFHRFQSGTNFKAWMLRLMTNLFINQYRKASRQGEQVDLEDLEDSWIYARMWGVVGSNPGSDPSERVLSKLGEEAIRAAIDSLPTDFRVVVTLVDVEECSYEEVAEAMEIPVGTVKSRLYRGRRQVQKRLWEDHLQGALTE
jgi:RNA polymerase sigma-70 factor (ECF subfamily)